ncbi:MAG: response regulator [Nitrospirota bacterium]|nr:MAG: response regulator [Nitrospirota bacterium]
MLKKIIIAGSISAAIEREKNILSRSQFNIFTTTSAAEALDIHRKNKADLIIADEDIKDMRGDELCETVRKDPDLRYISFILICGSTESDLRRCKGCGANTLLIRPFEDDELYSEVVRLVDVPFRKDIRVLTTLSLEGEKDGIPFFSQAENISVSGMLIKTDHALALGDIFSCSFHLDHQQISVKGEVVRVGESVSDIYHYGISFKEISPINRRIVQKFIDMNR